MHPSTHFRIHPISSSIFIVRLTMPFQLLAIYGGIEFPSMTMLAAVYSLIALWPISQLLAYNLASVLDNSIIGTPKVVCEESEVILDILTAKPFIGNVFVKGRAKDSSCRQSFDEPDSAKNSSSSYTLSLGKCGMQRLRSANPRGISFAVTVVVSFHPAGFITKNDRAYHLSCFYTEPEEIVTSSFEVSQLPAQELSDHMSMPSCRYSVHSGSVDGPQLSWANVGDIVFHLWECKGPELGMLVKKCFVTDGDGEDHPVVDEDGCSLDLGLLSEITYEDGKMRAHAKSQVFKYADSNQLFFTCQIRMCQKQMEMCKDVTPPKCGHGSKKGANGKPKDKTKEKAKLVKALEDLELDVLGTDTDWSVDEANPERAENVSQKVRVAQTEKEAIIAEKEELEENDSELPPLVKGRGRRALIRGMAESMPKAGALEVDVASPQMLVLDREDQARIGRPSEVLLLKGVARKADNHWKDFASAPIAEQQLCVHKTQLLIGLPLGFALLAITATAFTFCAGRFLRKRRGMDRLVGRKCSLKRGWPNGI